MPGSGLRGLVATEDISAGESAIAVPAALCVQLGSAASQGAVRHTCTACCHSMPAGNPATLMHPSVYFKRTIVCMGPSQRTKRTECTTCVPRSAALMPFLLATLMASACHAGMQGAGRSALLAVQAC